MITACPVCGSIMPAPFVERPGVPVLQNAPLPSAEAARDVTRGDLMISACTACQFVSNLGFDDALIRYAEGYENNQACSATFDSYLDSIIRHLSALGVGGKRIVEVGSGNGYFLRRLCSATGSSGTGFDPAYLGPLVDTSAKVTFVRDFYGQEYEDRAAEVVVCRHVIEHIPRPLELLGAIATALDAANEPLVFFETPAVDWILDRVVFHDFFYEHCSYFSRVSLGLALERSGYEVIDISTAFGGQYLWAFARPSQRALAPTRPGVGLTPAVDRYVALEYARLETARRRLAQLQGKGVVVWGGGAKGVTYLNLLDPHAQAVQWVIDINPQKQGKYVPGTGHLISPPPLQPSHTNPQSVLVMNPNYIDEVSAAVPGARVALALEEER